MNGKYQILIFDNKDWEKFLIKLASWNSKKHLSKCVNNKSNQKHHDTKVAKVGHAGIKPQRLSHWLRSRDVTAPNDQSEASISIQSKQQSKGDETLKHFLPTAFL